MKQRQTNLIEIMNYLYIPKRQNLGLYLPHLSNHSYVFVYKILQNLNPLLSIVDYLHKRNHQNNYL